MKINSINGLKTTLGVLLTAGTLSVSAQVPKVKSLTPHLTKDVFVKIDSLVPPKGTTDTLVLKGAPSPFVFVEGIKKTASIVVDLSKNVLYKFNDTGEAEAAYRVASGKKSTPTHTGLRIVSHVETYPYKNAPASSKRRNNPNDYGPKIIVLDKLDPKTGETSYFGEFIHGNRNPSSIGKYASKGCVRMDNQVIRILSTQVKRGDLVWIKK